MTTREEVFKKALEPSPEDQEILRIPLDERLNTPEQAANGVFTTPELAAKWSAEIDRRIEAYQRGEMKAQDSDTVMQELRNYLHDKNQQRHAS